MAATDQNYRSQRGLDIVFGASCILMLASIVWMFAQDYFRSYKPVQRRYRDVEEAMAERQLLTLVPDDQRIGAIQSAQEEVANARKDRDAAVADVRVKIDAILNQKTKRESKATATKADYDSLVSLYHIAVEKRDAEPHDTPRWKQLNKEADDLLAQVNRLKGEMDELQLQIDKDTNDIDQAKEEQRTAADKLANAEARLKDLSADFERFAKLVAQKRWKTGDWFRSLPVIDAFATPTRIDQVTLNDLPINYNFKYVTRYDRCGTCHLGMIQPSYTKAALRSMRDEPSKDLLAWLNDSSSDTNLPDNLKNEPLADQVRRLKTARALLAERQKTLNDYSGAGPKDLPWVSLKLTDPQVNQYSVHPHLELFVDEKSPHPALTYGCTICHAGQGSATDFQLAAHSPNTSLEKGRWVANEHWEVNHDWEYPMLPSRFIESSCIKCHHQVVDLLPKGELYDFRENVSGKRDKVHAPGAKVVRGYNIVREVGCFGCHEIAGMKDGRPVGPDLRLEPSPPLEDLTPAERLKLTADSANPVGSQRRVGPSLRRLSEKTNQDWVRKWVYLPRGFRPETRMPHFYNVANNNEEALAGTDQKGFPEAEVTAIAYYLIRESQAYLQGADISQRIDQIRKEELEDLKNRNQLSEKQKTELQEVLDRMKLREEHKPVPIKQRLIAEDGSVVQLPPAAKDGKAKQEAVQHGRQLFTERGCLACHSNAAVSEKGEGLPAVPGEQHFGPELSRLAAKIHPEGGTDEDARRWVVQWVMNPPVHSPRTKMPITHLTPQEASDVAAWLLSRPSDWKQPDLPAPGDEVLERLARVYLSKAIPRRSEVDEVFTNKGLPKERIKDLRRTNPDADELHLDAGDQAESWPDKLKWYIGRKAINNMGCFGCHDIPGFENAKPIGTPLNDWGKKDPDRLAFEDVLAYVRSHHKDGIDDRVTDDQDHGKLTKDGKPVYERYFLDLLERHTREGFLQQKLREPRSYDYNRLRTWDDRLRMPQFRFTQGKAKRLPDESQEQADAREEAEARDAVMTFVLGLVADPIPLQYVYRPPADRKAEVEGVKVLDKYNCAGCHQLRPGTYEFTTKNKDLMTVLDDKYKQVNDPDSGSLKSDFPSFRPHNAWQGIPSGRPDRIVIHGIEQREDPRVADDFDPHKAPADATIPIRLTEAVRYTKALEDVRDPKDDSELKPGTYDIPAGEDMPLPRAAQLAQADKQGGTLADLLVPYLMERNPTIYKQVSTQVNGKVPKESTDARSALPPPLLREGEKAQPAWLFQFLRNPYKIRPATVLRMPRFNMSPDEAMALVNYFAAVDKLGNPDTGIGYPYLAIKQRDTGFLTERSEHYVDALKKSKPGLDAQLQRRVKEFHQKPAKDEPSIWEHLLRDKTDQVQEQARAAERTVNATTGEEKARAKKEYDQLKKELDVLKDKTNKHAKEQEALVLGPWKQEEIYATDAFRIVANKDLCFKCHQVGNLIPEQAIGPPLNEAAQRLRPEWTELWIGSPQRLLIYPVGQHPMPQAFPRDNPTQYNDIFVGTPLDRVTALRDILMIYPRVADMPENRYYRPGQGGSQ